MKGPAVRLRDLPPELRERAKAQKRKATEAEQTAVCDYFERAGVGAPVPEFRFHETRGWRFDYAWPDSRVALEVEGGVWTGGRHVRGAGYLEDMEKYSEAAALGWLVLRCTPEALYEPTTLHLVRRTIATARKDS